MHLGIEFPENYPSEIIQEDLAPFFESGLSVDYKIKENEVYAALEWTIPTAIAAYVFKPYFEAFLQEAGKQHFEILSKNLKKLFKRGKQMNVKLVASSYSPNKLNKSYNQSMAISLLVQTKNGKFIKLLFDNDLEKEDWDSAIDQILDFVIENYENYENNSLSILTKNLNPETAYMIYSKINKETKVIEFHNNATLITELQNNNNR